MTTATQTQNVRERFAVSESNGGLTGRATPYNVPNGRPGYAWRIDEKGLPEVVEYSNSVFEPGCFAEWFAGVGRNEIKFLFQHGDATQGWDYGIPFGVNSLPIGTITGVDDKDDGLYITSSFAAHAMAQAVHELYQTGGLSELSACTVALDYDIRPAADESGELWRYITKAQMWEVSAVVWGQYGLNAAVTEVFSKVPGARERFEASYTIGGDDVSETPDEDEPATSTVVSILGAKLYDVLTDTAQDWLEDGVINVDEFVPLSELITRLVQNLDAGLDEIGIADRSVAVDADDEVDMASHRTARRDYHAGAAISKANAEPLTKAVGDMRDAAQMLQGHADAIEQIVTDGTHSDDSEPSASDDSQAAKTETANRNRARFLGLPGFDLGNI